MAAALSFRQLARGVALFALAAAISASAETAPVGEYELKAAFLYNFTKFVDWPERAWPNPREPLQLCVLGKDPFGEVLDRTVEGTEVREHPLVVRRIESTRQAHGCHVVFVGADPESHLSRVLRDLADEGALTVGEADRFTAEGGMIAFRREGNRIRLEINVDAVQRAGLRMSSELLKLARIVRESRSE
jgi:hypothetical protein